MQIHVYYTWKHYRPIVAQILQGQSDQYDRLSFNVRKETLYTREATLIHILQYRQ